MVACCDTVTETFAKRLTQENDIGGCVSFWRPYILVLRPLVHASSVTGATTSPPTSPPFEPVAPARHKTRPVSPGGGLPSTSMEFQQHERRSVGSVAFVLYPRRFSLHSVHQSRLSLASNLSFYAVVLLRIWCTRLVETDLVRLLNCMVSLCIWAVIQPILAFLGKALFLVRKKLVFYHLK